MHYTFRNVNDAFREMVRGIHFGTIPTEVLPSRVGEVASIPEPVILTYKNPRERVLINAARDANPAFHLYEALFLLAGRNEIAPLEYYSANYAKQVQDGNASTANASYGFRWRKATTWDGDRRYEDEETMDQLKFLIDHLRRKPESRRAVLAMWNVKDDLLNIEKSKDVACNLNVCFSVETGRKRDMTTTDDGGFEIHDVPRYLNMTVFNRSNDLIWGALGANYCHFTILQEYLAAHLGLDVGVYHQVSNNMHVYTERFEAEMWLNEYGLKNLCSNCTPDPKGAYEVEASCDICGSLDYCQGIPWEDPYARMEGFRLVSDPVQFDAELPYIVEKHRSHEEAAVWAKEWKEPFFAKVAEPMFNAFHCHKNRAYDEAVGWVNRIEAEDWRAATLAWILKRKERYEKRVSSRPE